MLRQLPGPVPLRSATLILNAAPIVSAAIRSSCWFQNIFPTAHAYPVVVDIESHLALWAAGGERAEDFDRFRQDKALSELIGDELPDRKSVV